MTTTPTDHDHAATDNALERWLTDHHVTWRYDPDYPLDRIDAAKSLANQARVGAPLIEEVVDQYTDDYRRGDRFPALLVHETRRAKKATILGGNHRWHGATRAGLATHPAYIVTDAAPETLVAAMYADNRRHGARLTTADRVHQAVHLVNMGWTQAAAAAELGISAGAVSRGIVRLEGTQRARALDLADAWDKLPEGHQARLAAIGSDPVFGAAVELVADAHLAQKDVDDLCRQVKTARSESAALTAVAAEREVRAHDLQRASFGKGAKKPRAEATAYTRARGAVDTILGLDPAAVAASSPNQDTTVTLRRKLKEAARHLMTIDKALGAR